MPAISVGSVEVDVLPNARGIDGRLRAALVPSANQIGDEVGRIIGRQIANRMAPAIRDGINNGARAARPAAARQGDETAGAFSRSLKARLEAAFRSLPRADVRLSTTGVDADLARLRARMETLSGKRIGIDIDAGAAVAEITEIEARLRRLGAQHPNVQVRADTAAALAQLAAVRAEIDAVDGQSVDIDTSRAVSSFGALATAAIAFGPAIIPALPVVAAGLGAIAAAATAAGAGIGAIGLVAIPAFKGIGSALQAQKAAQDAATNASLRGGQAASQGASKALQMQGAQQALATAHRNAARQISQAERGVSDAVRSASEANRRAKQQLADAVQQAADRQRQAAEQVRQAEDSLADAQRSARQAQEDLNQARRDAAQDLAELTDRLANAQLGERDAVLSVQEAQQRLRAVQAEGSNASLIEQQRAQLAYDQAVQRLKEARAETKNLSSEKKAADKAGVEGSETVKDAQERLREADEAVVDQQRALTRARQDAARQQVEAQQAVAEAQRNVARTQEDGARSVARAQEQLTSAQQSAADSIASAQRQIASASLSAAGGVDQAAIAQAKYQQELAKLTPAARETMNAYIGLRDAFSAWSNSLQPAVMPIFTRALNGMKNSLPGLTPFVRAAAEAIGDLQDRASRGFKSPWWQSFKTDLAGSVKPAIVGLGVAFANVFKGMGGIIQAFLPHMDSISDRMQTITARFATWGTSLKGSPEFERFLAYSAEQGPILAEMFGNLFGALLNLGVALAPLGGTAISFINALAAGINAIPTDVLTVLGVAFASIAIGAKLAAIALGIWRAAQTAATIATALLTGQTLALNAAMRANLIGIIITAIAALVVAIIYAWQNWDAFRNVVLTVWNAIKTAALFVWNSVLKPTFSAIVTAVQAVGRWAMWLWTNAIKPAWDAISLAARILLTAVVVAVILPIIVAVKVLGAIAMWLWQKAIKPAFEAIGALAAWLYRNMIKPYFDRAVVVFRAVARVASWLWRNALAPAFRGIAAAAKWLYTNGIKPAFGWIADRASWVWNKGVKPAFDLLKAGVRAVADSFRTAKNYIGQQWAKLKDIARKPVQYVVDVVYNNGVRGVWNKVAGAFGAPKLPKYTFASGGVMPGYTPGRDVHKFLSPTGGALELSGGEAIMRPEFTRAVGSGFVNTMNSIARSHGAQGIKSALAPVFGGNPTTSTDRSLPYANGGVFPHQKFADGGIFGWIKSAASAAVGAGSAAWNGIKKGASWLKDTLEASARAGVKNIVDPLLRNFPGMDTGFGKMIRRIPNKILDALFGYSKKADDKGAGGIGGPRIQAALRWAKTQNGLPYQWGGNGNPSWDCSGFVSAIESVIRGQKPHRRWSTHAFSGRTAPPGWVYHGNSPFRIGITAAGVGHTAGTLGKTKVESRGGDGVVVGSRARGYNDRLFTSWYGFKPGSYDSGGYLQPGMNLAFNGTGRPEPVFTTAQANALTSLAARSAQQQLGDLSVAVFVGNEQITDIARTEVRNAQGELIQVLNAG